MPTTSPTDDEATRATRTSDSPSDDARWEATTFEQPGALPGTNIAAVHSEDGSKVAIFYQEKDSELVYCRFVC